MRSVGHLQPAGVPQAHRGHPAHHRAQTPPRGARALSGRGESDQPPGRAQLVLLPTGRRGVREIPGQGVQEHRADQLHPAPDGAAQLTSGVEHVVSI
jgi:hypothetical protein